MDRRWESDADRSGFGNLEMLELLANDFTNGLRGGNFRGKDLQTRFGKLALFEVNRGCLNARATNVNAKRLCSFNHLRPLLSRYIVGVIEPVSAIVTRPMPQNAPEKHKW